MEYDAVIAGGGPVAGYIAAELGGSGFSVLVLEEHGNIGKPVQCAGLVTTRIEKILNISPCIKNTVNGAHIFSPKMHELVLDSGGPKAHVIDRAMFDRMIIERAKDTGVRVLLGARVASVNRYTDNDGKNKMEIKVLTSAGKIRYRARLVIGADGANSDIRRILGFEQPKMILKGMGREFNYNSIPQDHVQIFSGNDIAPGFFAWVIPAEDSVRIGLCIAENNVNLVDYFNRFEKLCADRGLIPDTKPVQKITGTIPLGALERTTEDNVMLVGDAAAQVKPTSGGGIYPGLRCAQVCSDVAKSALEAEELSNEFLERYHYEWQKLIGNELEKGLRLHRAFLQLTDDKIEEAFDILDNPEVLDAISRKGDIESPFTLAKLLFKKAPKLIKFAGPYFKSFSLK
jgi:geranylgeranyl reductase family protein